MLKKLFLLCSFLVCVLFVQAQKRTVTGTIVDPAGLTVIGATVQVKGTTIGVISDFDGKYSIKIPALRNPVLVFSYVGMGTKEVKVDNQKVVNVTLEDDTQALEEVVAIGYGVVKRKELTGAAIQVGAESLEKTVTSDVAMALQGAVPGLNITSSTGEPGSNANIQIRGITSISGSNTPLFVVDGIPQEGDPMISSNEIQQIDVLKDAASCAIYGTRGAAGVILITTKSGEEGKLKITLDATAGVQSINERNLPQLMNSSQQTYFDLISDRVADNYTFDDGVNLEVNKRLSYYRNNTDIYAMLIDNHKPEQSYTLTASGGNKKVTFSTVAGYYNQKGVLTNAMYDRFNFRTNVAYKGDRLDLKLGASYMLTNQHKANGTSIGQTMALSPYSPELDFNSSSFEMLASDSEAQSTAQLIRSIRSKNNTQIATSNIDLGLNYKITQALSIVAKGGLRSQSSFNETMTPNITMYDIDGNVVSDGMQNSLISNTSINRHSYTFTGGLNYMHKWESGHKVSGIAMYSYEQYNNKGFTGGRNGLITNELTSLNVGTLNPYVRGTNGYTDKLMGLIGRVMYDYKSRYLFSASMRADASSKFSKNNRWGMFPSVSAGWNVSYEEFWKPLEDVISQFKIRGSYGTTGNQNFASYSFASYVHLNYDYSFGNNGFESLEGGAVQLAYANPDLKWETSVQTNVGFDLGFLQNKLLFTADFYDTRKRDMLATVQLPPSVGVGTGAGAGKDNALQVRNIGNMTNRGMEFNLSYKYTKKDFWMNSSINYAKNVNRITNLGNSGAIIYSPASTVINGDPTSTVSVFAEGYEAGAFFLYETDGIVNTPEKLTEYQLLQPDAKMGDVMYVDQPTAANPNGDGKISNDDRVYSGSALPDFEMGLNISLGYKDFDVTTNWYASIGNMAINGAKAESYSKGRNVNLLSAWSEQNSNSNIPAWRGDAKKHTNYRGANDLWLEDASFLRMQLLSIGYTFKHKKYPILPTTTSCRVFVSGQNLLTLTKYTGLDPEIGGNGLTNRGIDRGNYPISRKIMLGLKVNF